MESIVSQQLSVQKLLSDHFSPNSVLWWHVGLSLKDEFLTLITAVSSKPFAVTRAECATSPHKYLFVVFSPQTENDLIELWNKTGHQGNKWNRAEVPLRKLRNFEVIFEGIRSFDVSGGAALDDLEFIDCAPSRWHAPAGLTHFHHTEPYTIKSISDCYGM